MRKDAQVPSVAPSVAPSVVGAVMGAVMGALWVCAPIRSYYRGNRTYRDHQGTSQAQGPPVDFRSLQVTCGRMNRLQVAGGNKRRMFAKDAYLTRGTASRPPVTPCTTCLHSICIMFAW
jgi:hypothetical protein